MQLVPIEQTGTFVSSAHSSPEVVQQVVEATVSLYERRGYQSPWVGYLAVEGDRYVGCCGFAGPPANGEVEIAYFTFPGNEGRGVATRMARELLDSTRSAAQSAGQRFIAHTLAEEGPSTSILRKLGFELLGEVTHPEDGVVWKWRERPPHTTRRQLSMFMPTRLSAELEAARQLLDPQQRRLIPAHVTLCREDELAEISESTLRSRLASPNLKPLTLTFGAPEAFDGHGVLLRCVGGEREFDLLRRHVIGTEAIRDHTPHMTIAHPRNPKSPNNCPLNVARIPAIGTVTFTTVCLIEQRGDDPWTVLQTFELRGA